MIIFCDIFKQVNEPGPSKAPLMWVMLLFVMENEAKRLSLSKTDISSFSNDESRMWKPKIRSAKEMNKKKLLKIIGIWMD